MPLKRIYLALAASTLAAAGVALYLYLAPGPEQILENTYRERYHQAEALGDPELEKRAIQQLQDWYKEQRQALVLDRPPEEARHSLDANALIEQYPDLSIAAQRWLGSLFFKNYPRQASASTLIIGSPFIRDYPVKPLFPATLDWDSASLADGRVIALGNTVAETGVSLIKVNPGVFELHDRQKGQPAPDSEHRPPVVALNGHVEIVIPSQVQVFSFSPKDVGSTRTQGNLSVTLLKVGPYSAEFELHNSAALAPELSERGLDPLVIQAQDRDGNYLKAEGSIEKAPQQRAFEDQQLQTLLQQPSYDPGFFDRQRQQLAAFHRGQASRYKKQYFSGELASLKVTALDFSAAKVERQTLKTAVDTFAPTLVGKTLQPMPATAVVYDERIAEQTGRYAMSEEEHRRSVKVQSELVSVRYARIRFHSDLPFDWKIPGRPIDRKVDFYTQDKLGRHGDLMDVSPNVYDVDPYEGWISYSPADFRREPAFAKGTMTLIHPKVEKTLYPVDALPPGMRLQGNALILESKPFPKERWRFFARDSQGRYLRKIHQVSHLDKAYGSAMFDVQYYYGEPTSIEAYKLVSISPLLYDYDIELQKPENPCYVTDNVVMAGCL